MEQSVLREVLLTHIHDLNQVEKDSFSEAKADLIEAFCQYLQVPFLKGPLLVSANAFRCRTDDVVSLRQPEALGRILFHLRYQEEYLTLVQLFEKVGTNTFQPREGSILTRSKYIRGTMIYKTLEGGKILACPAGFFAA